MHSGDNGDLRYSKLIATLGEPTSIRRRAGAAQPIDQRPEGALLAWTRGDGDKISNMLAHPLGFPIQIGDRHLQVPGLPRKRGEIQKWLEAHAALYRRHGAPELEFFAAPLLGLLGDQKAGVYSIHPAAQKVHMLLPENYAATSFEFLGDPEFVDRLDALKKLCPALFVPSGSPVRLSVRQKRAGLCRCQYEGKPVLKSGERPPRCPVCDSAMPLNSQIELAHLPPAERKRIGGEGILQLFHCRREECLRLGCGEDDDGRLPYLCRIVAPGNLRLCEMFRGLPFRPIVDWFFEEYDGYDLDAVEAAANREKFPIEPDSDFEQLHIGCFPYGSDKLGGLPSWQIREDRDEFPKQLRCPDCAPSENNMQFVYQYRSDERNKFEFADAGQFLIFQCAKHRHFLRVFMESC